MSTHVHECLYDTPSHDVCRCECGATAWNSMGDVEWSDAPKTPPSAPPVAPSCETTRWEEEDIRRAMNRVEREAATLDHQASNDAYQQSARVKAKRTRALELRSAWRMLDAFRRQCSGHGAKTDG